MDAVKSFLKRFHSYDNIDDVFSNGCCYWFAIILLTRFIQDGAEIMYDQIANHFGTCINGRVYDITGDVTNNYKWEAWSDLDDDLLEERIMRDCIMF